MIHELEDAMIARIRAALDTGIFPYKIPTLENYSGQIDEQHQSTFKFPAIFCSFVKWQRKTSLGQRTRLIEVELMVYVCSRNPRNGKSARQGSANEVGSYQMAEDVVGLLENQRLGLPMHDPLMAMAVETIYIAKGTDGHNAESILAIPFRCEFVWQAALDDCDTVSADDWLRTGQKYYVPDDDTPEITAEINHE